MSTENQKPMPHPVNELAAQALALFLQLNDAAQLQYLIQLRAAAKLHPRSPA